MKHHDSFTNSTLGRVKPQRRVFRSFINEKLKRNRSQIGLVEDRTSSTTIVRIIIGLLMLHLVIIGGVLLKGHFDKLAGGVVVPPTVTPPPSIAKPVLQAEEMLPQATATTDAAPAAPASTANHITQPAAEPELFPEDDTAVAVPAANSAPVVVTPPVAPAAPAAPAATAPAAPAAPAVQMTTIKHLVNSGDTWYGIATEYGITIDALKAANPAAARRSHLYQGSYISVPVPANSPAAKAAAKANTAPAAPAAATYTVKRGDTLAKIARKHKMSVAALMKLNGLTAQDARNIKVGRVLKVGK